MEQRLQKLLAAAGIGSRRCCEGLVSAGRVSVNGEKVAELGAKADPDVDDIRVDGKPLSKTEEKVYIVVNKPLDYVTTVKDPHAQRTVMELVKEIPQRIYPVGRLDADSAGLLIMSNDGEFTQRLTHPSHQVRKTYRVVVRGEVSEWAAADLRKGIVLDDGMSAPAQVEWVDYDEANNASIIDVTIHEGRNRQVRRMFEAVGYPVLALTRIRIGPIKLKGIAPGAWRRLQPSEVAALLDSADSGSPELPQTPLPDELPGSPSRQGRTQRPHLRPVKANPRSVRDSGILSAARALTERLNAPDVPRSSVEPAQPRTKRATKAKPKPSGRKS